MAKTTKTTQRGRKPPKVAKTREIGDTNQEKPLFCFRYADRSTTEAWKFDHEEGQGSRLLHFMCEMCKLTWREVLAQKVGTAKGYLKKHHDQPVDSICKEAQDDLLRSHVAEDLQADSIFRFRLGGEERLWGFRDGRTFHVVWWDPGHDVYPTEPN